METGGKEMEMKKLKGYLEKNFTGSSANACPAGRPFYGTIFIDSLPHSFIRLHKPPHMYKQCYDEVVYSEDN